MACDHKSQNQEERRKMSSAAKGMMNKVVVTAFDAADAVSKLAVVEAAIPTPAANQVLVHMRARPVNPADTFSIMGVYPGFAPKELPATPGLEGMGVVAQFGPGAKAPMVERGMPVGARVVPLQWSSVPGGSGTYAEYVVANVDDCVAVPEAVTDVSAAQLLVNPLTVLGMLATLAPPPGGYVLQAAGGSTLGKQLVQVAKKQGFKTISTVRRRAQVEELLAYGADHVICTEDTPVGPELSAKIMELTGGEGAWGAVDPVAGAMTAALSDGVRAGGKVLVYGALDGLAFTGSVVSTLFRGVQVNGYWVTPWLMGLPTAADRRAKMTEAMDLMASGVLVPHSGNTFALQDVQAAFAEANRPGRSSDGKVLLVTPAASMDTDLKEEA